MALRDRVIENHRDVMPVFPLCNGCIHLVAGGTCEAFPGGIPVKILTGQHDHRKPYKGDNGIRFEPIEEEKPKS